MTVPATPVVEPFDAVDVIAAKRDGARLSDPQIDWVIDAYTRGVVADEQMSALAMAIYLGGMDRAETARWTGAMIRSGERMDFSRLGRPTADKHSTGGVGDKTTLPPLLRRNRTDLDAELDRSRRRGPRGWEGSARPARSATTPARSRRAANLLS